MHRFFDYGAHCDVAIVADILVHSDTVTQRQ